MPDLPAGVLRSSRLPLSTVLIVAVVCLNVLVFSVGLRGLWASRQNAEEQATLTLSNLSNVLERNLSTSGTVIDFALQGIVDSLEQMLAQGALRDEAVENLLTGYDKRYGEASGFWVSQADGVLRWGSNLPQAPRLSIADRDYFVRQRDNAARLLIISPPLQGKITQKPTVVFSRPFQHPDGRFAGVVIASVPIAFFNQILADVFLGTRGIAAIRHLDYSLVTVFPPSSHPNVVVGTKLISGELRTLLEQGVQNAEYQTANAPDGVDRLYFYRTIPHLQMMVIAGLSPGDFMDNWHQEVRNTLILLLAVATLSFFGTRLLIRAWRQKTSDFNQLQSQEGELRDALKALHGRETRFRILFEDTPDAIVTLDQETGQISACNNAAARLMRGDRTQLLGKTPAELSPQFQPDGQKSRDAAAVKILAALSSGYLRFDWVHQRLDGELFWAEVALAPSVLSDERIMFAVWRDISDRKRVEQELHEYQTRLERMVEKRTTDLMVAKEAAEAASRAKTAFLSMASHELRTPMNGVMGTLALAIKQTTDPKLLDYLAKAERASRQLLAIINDVLDISRIESARLKLAEEDFDLADVRRNVLDAVETLAVSKGLLLSFPLDQTLAAQRFVGDPLRLTQILINLIGNAVKFTTAGQISVNVRAMSSSAPQAARLRFTVQDTGIGIRPADLERIFEPFEQSGGSHEGKRGGTGLGLALCKRLVEAMQGEIGVSSQPGAGSLFWFEIALGRAKNEALSASTVDARPDAELRARHAGTVILLVDDEPLNLEIGQAMLEEVGLQVLTADDGETAVAQARSAQFKLVLMDMNMPRMSGIDATRQIRQIAQHACTPIIAMTANAFIEDREACLQAGMNDHIGKPVIPEVLFKTLLKWLDHPPGDDLRL